MDKIRFSLSDKSHDFARLYNWSNDGFRHDSAAIFFPSQLSLTLLLVSVRQYQVVIEGEATLNFDTDVGSECMRFYTVSWSDLGRRTGNGSATIRIVNPDFPTEPFVIGLTLGEFRYEHAATWTGEKTIGISTDGLLGLQMMLSQEVVHAAFEVPHE